MGGLLGRRNKGSTITSLYVTTREQAKSYFTGGPKPPGIGPDGRVTLSFTGCEVGCATVTDDAAQSLVIGNDDGVFFFSPEVGVMCV